MVRRRSLRGASVGLARLRFPGFRAARVARILTLAATLAMLAWPVTRRLGGRNRAADGGIRRRNAIGRAGLGLGLADIDPAAVLQAHEARGDDALSRVHAICDHGLL